MSIPFDREFDPARGRAVEVAPAVRRITAGNPGPYTFHGTNTYLVGRRSVVVIDPGPDDAEHRAAILAAVGRAPLSAILLTHAHDDHAAGAPALAAATGAPVLAAEGGASADRLIADGAAVPSEAGPLTAVATPGHVADHLCFALAGGAHLFSGDHVMAWSTTVVIPPEGSMADYMASLDRLAARPERTYWPGHGGPVRDGPAFVVALAGHRRDREGRILAALAGGARSLEDVVAAAYPGLDPALARAAAHSAEAHLLHLAGRGLAVAEAGAGGTLWRPA